MAIPTIVLILSVLTRLSNLPTINLMLYQCFDSFCINKTLKRTGYTEYSIDCFDSFCINKTLKLIAVPNAVPMGFDSFCITKTLKL